MATAGSITSGCRSGCSGALIRVRNGHEGRRAYKQWHCALPFYDFDGDAFTPDPVQRPAWSNWGGQIETHFDVGDARVIEYRTVRPVAETLVEAGGVGLCAERDRVGHALRLNMKLHRVH